MIRFLNLFIKRLFDFFAAFLGIIVLLPFFIIIAIAIKLTSKGPVFFTHKRPGKKAKIFKIYKFRTMKLGSEKMVKGVEVTSDDNRVTKIGKVLRRFKIDELPQLFNVLFGQMSLIGPRPERIESLIDYDEEIKKRLDMKPGLTGLAQVSGNIYIPLSMRYKYDCYYVKNFNLFLDLKIFLRTIGVLIKGEERYANKGLGNIDIVNQD